MNQQKGIETQQVTSSYEDAIMYNRRERMPILKPCFDTELTWGEIKNCSDEKLLEIIYTNLKMPKEVRGICNFHKRVIVQFSIGVDGVIYNIRFPRKEESYFQEEAKRLVCLLPDWKPGNMYGKDVEVTYTLPIKFD